VRGGEGRGGGNEETSRVGRLGGEGTRIGGGKGGKKVGKGVGG